MRRSCVSFVAIIITATMDSRVPELSPSEMICTFTSTKHTLGRLGHRSQSSQEMLLVFCSTGELMKRARVRIGDRR
jgi:hypothetical protein